ncbi:hypothetical protein BC828DRAFT_394431 [Blastocladiella britannica]|nr:hypothetical protein BC828DRAFT_394431 [Blastocladiella britannica]
MPATTMHPLTMAYIPMMPPAQTPSRRRTHSDKEYFATRLTKLRTPEATALALRAFVHAAAPVSSTATEMEETVRHVATSLRGIDATSVSWDAARGRPRDARAFAFSTATPPESLGSGMPVPETTDDLLLFGVEVDLQHEDQDQEEQELPEYNNQAPAAPQYQQLSTPARRCCSDRKQSLASRLLSRLPLGEAVDPLALPALGHARVTTVTIDHRDARRAHLRHIVQFAWPEHQDDHLEGDQEEEEPTITRLTRGATEHAVVAVARAAARKYGVQAYRPATAATAARAGDELRVVVPFDDVATRLAMKELGLEKVAERWEAGVVEYCARLESLVV